MTTSKPYRVALAGRSALVIALSSAAWACPGCKEALATGENGGDLVSGFFWSILFMLSMPFLIFGTFCTAMYIAVRRARTAQAAAQATPARPQATATAARSARQAAPRSAATAIRTGPLLWPAHFAVLSSSSSRGSQSWSNAIHKLRA